MNKAAQVLREKSYSELREELLLLRRERFNLRMQHAVQQLNKNSELVRVRRGIARVLGILKEKDKEAVAVSQTVVKESDVKEEVKLEESERKNDGQE